MNEYATYVGMDVHVRSITCRALEVETGEQFDRTFADCPSAEVLYLYGWLQDLPQPVYCAYESCCA